MRNLHPVFHRSWYMGIQRQQEVLTGPWVSDATCNSATLVGKLRTAYTLVSLHLSFPFQLIYMPIPDCLICVYKYVFAIRQRTQEGDAGSVAGAESGVPEGEQLDTRAGRGLRGGYTVVVYSLLAPVPSLLGLLGNSSREMKQKCHSCPSIE